MEVLTNRNVIKDILERHGFRFSKRLGQNFIVNPSICPRIAELGGATENVGVLEIGAGIGVLTAELAQRAKKVVCVEIDDRLLPILDETLADFSNIKIVNNDVLKTDLHKLIKDEFEGMDVVVCANLPYYITSPIIMYLLEERLPIKSITIMVQKEAAERICAKPGTRECGAISAAVNYYCTPEVLFNVSPGSFVPEPDVDSCVIRLTINEKPPIWVANEELLFKVIKGAFSMRRKTILNNLSANFLMSKDELRAALLVANVPENARAENLTLQDFAAITDELVHHTND